VYLSLPHFTLQLFLVSGDVATGKTSGFCFGYENQIEPHHPEFMFLIELGMNLGIQSEFVPKFGLRRPNWKEEGKKRRKTGRSLATNIELKQCNSIYREIKWI